MAAGSPGADPPVGAGVGQSAPSCKDQGQGHKAQDVQPDCSQALRRSSARASPCPGQTQTSECQYLQWARLSRPGDWTKGGWAGRGQWEVGLFPEPKGHWSRPGASDDPTPQRGKPADLEPAQWAPAHAGVWSAGMEQHPWATGLSSVCTQGSEPTSHPSTLSSAQVDHSVLSGVKGKRSFPCQRTLQFGEARVSWSSGHKQAVTSMCDPSPVPP